MSNLYLDLRSYRDDPMIFSEKILRAGQEIGLRANFHADELHPLDGAVMAAKIKACFPQFNASIPWPRVVRLVALKPLNAQGVSLYNFGFSVSKTSKSRNNHAIFSLILAIKK